MQRRSPSSRLRLIALGFGISTVLSAVAANAVWQEPTTFPGNPSPPLTEGLQSQTRTGALTVTGELSAQNPSTLLPSGGTGSPRGSVSGFGGAAQNTGSVAAGVYGRSNTTAGAGLEVGVLGVAKTNQSASVGVYGDAGVTGAAENDLAWAGYFKGATDISGTLSLQGRTGTCSNDPSIVCSGIAICSSPINYNFQCLGATFRRLNVTGSSATLSGNPAPSGQAGTLTATAAQYLVSVVSRRLTPAVLGQVTANGANAQGQGVVGQIPSAMTCATGARCAAIYASDGSTPFDIPGRWAGYFNGAVALDTLTPTVTVGGAAIAVDISEYETLVATPPTFSSIPSGSIVSFLNFAAKGIASDGAYLWMTDTGGHALAKIDPSSLGTVAYCDYPVGAPTFGQLTFDGQSLWITADSKVLRISASAILPTGGNCAWTEVAASTTAASTKAPEYDPFANGSTLLTQSVWYGSTVAGQSLVELNPKDLTTRSSTQVNSAAYPVAPGQIADDGTHLWVSIRNSATDSRLARLTKSSKVVDRYDYTVADCLLPNCLTRAELDYRGAVYGGGYIWVTAWDHDVGALLPSDPSTGRQIVLKIDPANPTKIVATYPGGYSENMVFAGRSVWSVTDSSAGATAQQLWSVRLTDGFTASVTPIPGTLTNTQGAMLFDGTALWVPISGTTVKALR